MIAQLNSHYIKTRPTKALTRLVSYAFFEGRPATTKGRWINPLVFSFLKVYRQVRDNSNLLKNRSLFWDRSERDDNPWHDPLNASRCRLSK